MFDVDKFIQCVQEHPSIWEKGCREYSDRTLKEKSWFAVGENMFETWNEITDVEKQEHVKEMKNKWRHIRDNFAKYTNQGSSGDPVSKRKKYIYADVLTFLIQSVEKRRTSGNMSIATDDDNASQEEGDEGMGRGEGGTEEEEAVDARVTRNIQTKSSDIKTGPSVQKRSNVRKGKKLTDFQSQLLDRLESSTSTEEDADKSFLLSLLPDYRRLDDDEKIDFRFHALQFFKDARRKEKNVIQQTATSSPSESHLPYTSSLSGNPQSYPTSQFGNHLSTTSFPPVNYFPISPYHQYFRPQQPKQHKQPSQYTHSASAQYKGIPMPLPSPASPSSHTHCSIEST